MVDFLAERERHREYMRRWRAENPHDRERNRESARRWNAAHPKRKRESSRRWNEENPEKTRENLQRWKAENPEKVRANNLRWKADNSEKVRASNHRWRVNNLEKQREHRHCRRARKAKTSGNYTAEQFKALCAHFNHHCLKCGRPRKLTPDHVIPLAWADRPEYQGVALNDIGNIQPLCLPCNSSKGATMVDYRKQPHPHCVNPPMVEDYLA